MEDRPEPALGEYRELYTTCGYGRGSGRCRLGLATDGRELDLRALSCWSDYRLGICHPILCQGSSRPWRDEERNLLGDPDLHELGFSIYLHRGRRTPSILRRFKRMKISEQGAPSNGG